jgi:hypothetical protein
MYQCFESRWWQTPLTSWENAVVRMGYLPDAALIRLFDFTAGEASHLQRLFSLLASGQAQRVALHELFVQPVNDCRLCLSVAMNDQGMLRTADPEMFECRLTPDGWCQEAERIKPSTVDERGETPYQWLMEGLSSEIALLLSKSGHW